MSHQVTITIDKNSELTRFQRATWKQGRMLEQPQSAKQVYNLQADTDDIADNGLMNDSFERWVWEGIALMDEYLSGTPSYAGSTYTITLVFPENWVIHSAPGLQYALRELVFNGMMSDWYDALKPDQATAFKKKAELNKAEIHSIVYSLNSPTVTVTSEAGTFPDEQSQQGGQP